MRRVQNLSIAYANGKKMNEFVLVWILVVAGNSYHPISFSPPVKSLEDCQKMQSVFERYREASKCVSVNILRQK